MQRISSVIHPLPLDRTRFTRVISIGKQKQRFHPKWYNQLYNGLFWHWYSRIGWLFWAHPFVYCLSFPQNGWTITNLSDCLSACVSCNWCCLLSTSQQWNYSRKWTMTNDGNECKRIKMHFWTNKFAFVTLFFHVKPHLTAYQKISYEKISKTSKYLVHATHMWPESCR